MADVVYLYHLESESYLTMGKELYNSTIDKDQDLQQCDIITKEEYEKGIGEQKNDRNN